MPRPQFRSAQNRAESLEERICLSAASINSVVDPTVVHSGIVAAFEVDPNGEEFGVRGSLSGVNSSWKTVRLDTSFDDPIIIAGPPGFSDSSPGTVRIRNIASDRFEIRIQPWDYLDSENFDEQLDFLVVESGVYETAQGTQIVAGSTTSDSNWNTASFGETFDNAPVVLAQIASSDSDGASSLKIRGVTASGFESQIQTQAIGGEPASTETIHYVAIDANIAEPGLESGIVPNAVDHLFRQISFGPSHTSPSFFAMTQSDNESDAGHLRLQRDASFDSLTSTGVAVRFQEEDSRNAVTSTPDPSLRRHALEDLGFLVVDDSILRGRASDSGAFRTELPHAGIGYGALDVGDVVFGPGLTASNTAFESDFQASGWDAVDEADAIVKDDYLAIPIEIASGFTADLSNLEISLGSTDARSFSVFASGIGFVAGSAISQVNSTTSSLLTVDLTSIPEVQGFTGVHEIRVYGYGSTTGSDAGLKQTTGNELSLSAQVTASPAVTPLLLGTSDDVAEAPTAFAVFELSWDGTFYDALTFDLTLEDGTAIEGEDYDGTGVEYSLDGGSQWTQGTQGTLPIGQNEMLVRVPVLDDATSETVETFSLCLGLTGPTIDADLGSVTATILDDDRRVIITETGQSTTVSEFGVTDQIFIELSDAPSGPVQVAIDFDVPGEVIATPATLTFDDTNWNSPQLVELSGIDDQVADGNQQVNLLASVDALASAPDFAGAVAASTAVENLEEIFARVVGRHIFYNNSAYDNNSPLIDALDDQAIAPSPTEASEPELGKRALLPGETATFQNYTSYSRGINGIMIDVQGLADPNGLSITEDFDFYVGNDINMAMANLTEASDPSDLDVRTGDGLGGSDRITLIWPDNVIQKEWLKVVVKANEATGLETPDVHYWGNAIGESGNSAGNLFVNALDVTVTLDNPHSLFNPANIEDSYDYNRDRFVNILDITVIQSHATNLANVLLPVTPPLTVSLDGIREDNESPQDFATFDRTLFLHGTFVEGSTLEVTFDGQTFVLGTDPELSSDGTGRWTLNYSDTVLDVGDHPVSITSELNGQTATANETVTILLPAPPPPPNGDTTSDLVAHWNFEDQTLDQATAGSVADDLTEQGKIAFILGGLGDTALHVDGGPLSGLIATDSADLNTTQLDEFSVALWFHTRDGIDGTRVLYQQGDVDRGLVIYLHEGQLIAGAWDVGIGWEGTWLTMPTKNYTWQHVTLTLDATADVMQLYADGVLADEGFAGVVPPHAAASIAGSNTPTRLWNPTSQAVEQVTPQSFLGWVDDVRVYRRVLIPNDAATLTHESPTKVVAELPIEANVPSPQYALPVGGTTHYIPATMSTADLQNILDHLQGNDIVRLDPAGTWESIILRTPENARPGVKYIISDAIDMLPAFGERVDPSYSEYMPTFTTGTADTAPIYPALNSEIGASDYHIAGIRFLKPLIAGDESGVLGDHNRASLVTLNRVPVGSPNNTLPALAPQVLGETATTYEALGGDYVFDRVIFEGDDLRTTNGLVLTAKDTAVVGSYFHKIIHKHITDDQGVTLQNPSETHGIEIVDSPGRILIENNYMSVGSIAVMAGNNGAQTTDTSPVGGQIPGLVPPMEDIVVRDNFITKDLAWASEILSITGTAALKNALETKGSNRLLWEGNHIENILNGNQKHALVVKVGNGQETDNVTIRNNRVEQATGGAAFSNQVDERTNEPLRVGNITVYDNDIIDIGPMPPVDDSFQIIRVSVVEDPIETLVMFDNNLRRRFYVEEQENGFAFTNNQLQNIVDFSFIGNAMDCGEWGGFAGTALGTNFTAILDNFTDQYRMEDNVFLGCVPGHNIPPGNRIFAASATIDSITSDNIVNELEALGTVTITGRLRGDAQENDVVTLHIADQTYTGTATLIGNQLRYSIDVPGSQLVADADHTIALEFTTTDFEGLTITPTESRLYQVDIVPPTLTINDVAGDNIINAVEDDTDLTISGTSDAEEGQLVTVNFHGTDYTGFVSSGAWSVVVPASVFVGFPVTTTVTAQVEDVAGNSTNATTDVAYDIVPPEAPIVEITEDANNNGEISNGELDGPIGVRVELPADAVIGDTLIISDGSTVFTEVLTTLDDRLVEFPVPVMASLFEATAELIDIAGNEGPEGSDQATIANGSNTTALFVQASTTPTRGSRRGLRNSTSLAFRVTSSPSTPEAESAPQTPETATIPEVISTPSLSVPSSPLVLFVTAAPETDEGDETPLVEPEATPEPTTPVPQARSSRSLPLALRVTSVAAEDEEETPPPPQPAVVDLPSTPRPSRRRRR